MCTRHRDDTIHRRRQRIHLFCSFSIFQDINIVRYFFDEYMYSGSTHEMTLMKGCTTPEKNVAQRSIRSIGFKKKIETL